MYVNCTVCKGRKFLPDKIKKPGKLLRGNSITFQSSRLANLTATVWQDTRDARFLSTCNKLNVFTKCTRRVGSRRVEVTTPSSASSYHRYYGSVDSFDKILTKRLYGSLGHGSAKFWKHLLWHFTKKRPKRCIVHSKYKPNNRNKKDIIYSCYQCNSHFCKDCFRLSHCVQT